MHDRIRRCKEDQEYTWTDKILVGEMSKVCHKEDELMFYEVSWQFVVNRMSRLYKPSCQFYEHRNQMGKSSEQVSRKGYIRHA